MSNEQQSQNQQDGVRKPYKAPQLVVYGDIASLTERNTLNVHRDNPGSTKS